MILRPSGTGDALVKFVDVNGQGLGCSLLNYVLPDARNFEVHPGDDGVHPMSLYLDSWSA
jgi:hypothetical protein